MIKVTDVKNIRELDKITIDQLGSGLPLMEEAGMGIFEAVNEYITEIEDKDSLILIMCGKGNNGGDGFVCARLLHNEGYNVVCATTCLFKDYKGDALINLDLLKQIDINIIENISDNWNEYENYDIIVDAIFGTGFNGELKDPYKSIINNINCSSAYIISVDTPSGINSDTGEVATDAVMADSTITMGLPKLGQLFYPAKSFTGNIKVKDIGLMEKKGPLNSFGNIFITDSLTADNGVLIRQGNEHKTICGKVLVVAGSRGFTGAGILASKAALKAGSGLVSICVPQSLNTIFETNLIEEITIPLEDNNKGYLDITNLDKILELAEKSDVLVLGPGLTEKNEVKKMVQNIVKSSPVPIILDADGINAFADNTKILEKSNSEILLTPHIGEFKRISKNNQINTGPSIINQLKDFQKKINKGIILKGAPSLICFDNDNIYLNTTGNPGMATAGSGDVLTGLIGGLFAQTKDLKSAAITGAYIHGLAGDFASLELGENFLTAQNIIEYLPDAFIEVTRNV